MKNPSAYKGIVELSNFSKKRVRLSEDEKILFGIGEVRWVSTGNIYIDRVQMRHDDFFNPYCMKNTIVTTKRIILPMTSFLGYNLDYIDIFYDKSFLEGAKKTFYKRYGFWINKYSQAGDSVVFELEGKEFNLGIILYSSVTSNILEAVSRFINPSKTS